MRISILLSSLLLTATVLSAEKGRAQSATTSTASEKTAEKAREDADMAAFLQDISNILDTTKAVWQTAPPAKPGPAPVTTPPAPRTVTSTTYERGDAAAGTGSTATPHSNGSGRPAASRVAEEAREAQEDRTALAKLALDRTNDEVQELVSLAQFWTDQLRTTVDNTAARDMALRAVESSITKLQAFLLEYKDYPDTAAMNSLRTLLTAQTRQVQNLKHWFDKKKAADDDDDYE